MLCDYDLLSSVQPQTGYYALFARKGESKRQHLYDDRDEFDAVAEQYSSKGWNVFYGVARFATDESRKKENISGLKALWVDIDCGEDKPYADQDEGIAALKAFCLATKLPRPTIVDSGRGWHVYWPLDEELSRGEWEALAERLRRACIEHDFEVDWQCFEAARVLRVPGTYNYKGAEPLLVEVVHTAPAAQLGKIEEILSKYREPEGLIPQLGKPFRAQSALMQKLNRENFESRWSRLEEKNVAGTGCQQLVSAVKDRATLGYDRWFDALSIATFCADREEAILAVSADHPGYDEAYVEKVAGNIIGPHSCAVFERNNPKGCAGCPHIGQIKSPILLARALKEETEADREVKDEPDSEEIVKLPAMPEGFSRGPSGGIYTVVGEGEKAHEACAYEYDLHAIRCVVDPDGDEAVQLRLYRPMYGVKYFTLSTSLMAKKDALKEALSGKGVMPAARMWEYVVLYVQEAVRKLMDERNPDIMRVQFGWADKGEAFIIGDKELTATGQGWATVSPSLEHFTPHMIPAGSFEKWREVIDIYSLPGHEPHMFGAMAGLGSILLKDTGQKGMLLNMVHPHSGTGKTTILKMAASFWGDPNRLVHNPKDTANARALKMSMFNNLPYCVDEMSNIEPRALSDFSYECTQGEQRERMQGAVNALRQNSPPWSLIALTSSNTSFYALLEKLKALPQGEMKRVIEYKIERTDVGVDMHYARDMFDKQLLGNYGWAGPMFIEAVLRDKKEVVNAVDRIRRAIDNRLQFSREERVWSAGFAAILGAGYLAQQANIVNFDLERQLNFSEDLLSQLKRDTKPEENLSLHTLSSFIHHNLHNVLVINGRARADGRLAMPDELPRGELKIRMEPDTRMIYIVASDFKRYCVDNYINYKETLSELERLRVFVETKNKHMSKGTKIDSPVARALVFNMTDETSALAIPNEAANDIAA